MDKWLPAIVFSVLLLVPVVPQTAFAGPGLFDFNGHCYGLTTAGTFLETEAEAVSLGGHLVTIDSQAENDFVQSLATTQPLRIGFNDIAVEGDHGWVSGSPVTFINWNAGEPNQGGVTNPSEEDSTEMAVATGLWNDNPISLIQPGVFEVVDICANVVPIPGGPALADLRVSLSSDEFDVVGPQFVEYTLTFTNNGPDAAQIGFQVRGPENGLDLFTIDPLGGCTSVPDLINCPSGTFIDANQDTTFTVTAMVNQGAAGGYIIEASFFPVGNLLDTNPTDNTATAMVVALPPSLGQVVDLLRAIDSFLGDANSLLGAVWKFGVTPQILASIEALKSNPLVLDVIGLPSGGTQTVTINVPPPQSTAFVTIAVAAGVTVVSVASTASSAMATLALLPITAVAGDEVFQYYGIPLERVSPGNGELEIVTSTNGMSFSNNLSAENNELVLIVLSDNTVGGEIIPIETTTLILAGAQSFSWMIPLILSGIGIGLFVVTRKSENS